MGGREIRAFVAASAGLLAIGAAQAGVLGSTVEAQGCAAAIGGSVSGAVTVICGIPPEKFEALVKERTAKAQRAGVEHSPDSRGKPKCSRQRRDFRLAGQRGRPTAETHPKT